MSRSLYKVPYVHRSLFQACLDNKEKNVSLKTNLEKMDVLSAKQKVKNIPKFLYFWKRSSPINPNLINKKICVYNGKVFITVNVTKKLIGYCLGNFSVTRRKPPHVGKQKHVKKVKKTIMDKKPAEQIKKERLEIINRNRPTVKTK
jgi:ribosomal protein S19